MKYNAFLSYSHAQDSDLAPHLETALEKFAKPLFKQRALHIFRDANDLSASPDLWGKIEEGLKNSEYFIFLASPKAAQSRWCQKEVEFWKANKKMSNFLVVMTDGDINWDESTSDFDWSKTTAIPDNLSGAFVNEPLYVDFRNHKNEESGLEFPDFKSKTVLLAATIHGKSVGNMIGENVRQHKKTLRIRNSAIGILSALLIAVGAAGFYANEQKKEAEAQTEKALLLSYLGNSRALYNEDPTISLRLAEHAYKFALNKDLPTQESIEQLIKVFYSGYGFYQQSTDKAIELYPKDRKEINGIRLDTGRTFQPTTKITGNGRVFIFEKDSLNNVPKIHRFETQKSKFGFSKDGSLLLTSKKTSLNYDFSIEVFDRETTTKLFEFEDYSEDGHPSIDTGTFNIPSPRSAPLVSNIILVAGGYLKKPRIYSSIAKYKYIELNLNGFYGRANHINDVAISIDGNYSILGSKNGKTIMIDNNEYAFKDSRLYDKDPEVLKYRDEGSFSSFEKDPYVFINKQQSTIDKVAFSNDGKFIITKNYINSDEETTKSAPQDSLVYSWKATPFPYIVIQSRPKFKDLPEISNGFYLEYALNDKSQIIFNKPYFLKNKQGIAIGEFTEFKNSKRIAINDHFYINNKGLYNSNDETLIKLNLNDLSLRESSFCISTNKKFIRIMISDSTEIYIFSIDPEFIIERFNNKDLFGSIHQLSQEEKDLYQIKDLN